MRCEHIQAVSSALLLSLTVFIPHHCITSALESGTTSIATSMGPLVSEFYPRGLCSDEYLVLSNQCGLDIDLRNWSLTDGEGRLMFISDMWLAQGDSMSISWNQSSFLQAYGRLPDISITANEADRSIESSGNFRLADSGDSVALCSPGGLVVDTVLYGSSNVSSPGWSGPPMPNLRQGEVARRIVSGGLFVDTDDAADWLPFREYRYGFTDFHEEAIEVGAGNITAFASPDNSIDVILDAIESAAKRISICSYEFSSVPVTKALAKAKQRGVDVKILVDGMPSGGMSDGELACLSFLAIADVDVRTIRGNASAGVVQHVGAIHAKYVIIDFHVSIVMSENFVEQGIPTDRLFGNRGWGVEVRDGALAAFIERAFEDDSRLSRRDVVPWRSDARFNQSALMPKDLPLNHSVGMFPPMKSTMPALVTACLSPDSSVQEPYICQEIEQANAISVEQFQADLLWQERWSSDQTVNPMILSLEASLKRGGQARVLLDSSWYNVPRNSAVACSLTENVTMVGLNGQFKLLDQNSPVIALHNKGVILDGSTTLISSNNWVSASLARNRELGLLIDSMEIAEYFSAVFELDWTADDTPPTADAGPDVELTLGDSVEIAADLSRDDRAIAEISWDTDGDGQAESWNMTVDFTANVLGSHRILLTVKDAWGNSATDEVIITVVASDSAVHGDRSWFGRGLAWIVPLIVGASYLLVRRMSSPKKPPDPRKLNHRNNA